MAIIASDLIASSLRLLGAIAAGETPTADEANDALQTLNELLDTWALSNLMVYRNENDAVALVPGQQSYTIGPGGTFNLARPVSIGQAFVTYQGVDFMLRPILTTDEWNRIALKGQQQPIPTHLYYVATYPLGVVNLWPVPSQALTLTLSLNMQFSQLTSVTQSLSYPPGYQKLLRYALAVELAPEYGIAPPPAVIATLAQTTAEVKQANRQQPVMRFDEAIAPGGSGAGLPGFLGGW